MKFILFMNESARINNGGILYLVIIFASSTTGMK